ncbi:MAG: NAD(P)H-binding protein [Burkholderiales bacterium]|nr:NAD(P)H-binding protein [Burkholderiales bacterium]
MARKKSVTLAGATGLVGGEALRLLLADPAFSRVAAIVRRPLEGAIAGERKLEQRVVDFERLEQRPPPLDVDTIVCALGTTIKAAGSQEAFRRVDYDYPLALARLGLAAGAKQFVLVSALGASAKSPVFYNRVKGELEDAVRSLGYASVVIVRPSLLLGARREFRLGEEIAKRFGFLAPGKYRPVAARDVANALVTAARDPQPGVRIIESDEIRALAR